MKRATILKVLAGTLVLTLMASAFPLAQVALKATRDADADARNAMDSGRADVPRAEDLPFLNVEGGSRTPLSDGASSPFGIDGTSSRPAADGQAFSARADASGSVLVQQVLGAAKLMGYDVAVPALPLEKVAASDPLRAAILAWIAATGSQVPADELARELARADAMPLDIQRDIALLILSTLEATTLQRAALARLTPQEIEYVHTHPELAEQLAAGIDTPQTRGVAVLASLVDMKKSVEATLLLLQAVDVTSGTFETAAAKAALDTAQLDPTTRAIIELVLQDQSATDADKIMMAANLVALGAGLDTIPAPGPAPSFTAALDALLAASYQKPSPESLTATIERANALPPDLRDALARIVSAQAVAINAANPSKAGTVSQAEALVGVLVASAAAMPTLEKYTLFWRDSPDAVRVGEWQPETRVGWAAHSAALVTSTRGDTTSLVRAAGMLNGHSGLATVAVPERSFTDALELLLTLEGVTIDAKMRADIDRAGNGLAPAVRDAAALMLSGAAESARLQKVAFAGLSPSEQLFLKTEAVGLDPLYAGDLTAAQRETLARASALAGRVDAEALLASGIVAAASVDQARLVLQGAGSFSTQGSATPVQTGFLAFLKRLQPFGAAQAQTTEACETTGSFQFILEVCPGEDIVLRVRTIFRSSGFGPTFGSKPPSDSLPGWTCDTRECVRMDDESTSELLVITGTSDSTQRPTTAERLVCPSIRGRSFSYEADGFQRKEGWFSDVFGPNGKCRQISVPAYGAPTVTIDLGGADTWAKPVAMVHNHPTIPVSLHLDIGGRDNYADPSPLYDRFSPMLMLLGYDRGHPTAGAAPFGGVAILVDAGGSDQYFANTRSQGFGRLGLGMLADLGLDSDLYHARHLSQGASGDSFTLGAGILVDAGGSDVYTVLTGQGYGIGGVLLDAGGADSYTNEKSPNGAPLVHLDIIPGGDVTTLDRRDDNLVWLDGPGALSIGLGIDTEAVPVGTQSDQDGDGYLDFAEFVAGTDPYNTSDTPVSRPTARAGLLLVDEDKDGYPDYVERILSTDPRDGKSYPAGFPAGVKIVIPPQVMTILASQALDRTLGVEKGEIDPFGDDASGSQQPLRGHDKIIDLRLPLQDAGTIDVACTGEYYLNSTTPVANNDRNIFLDAGFTDALFGPSDPDTGGPQRDSQGRSFERCVGLAYAPNAPGNGTAAAPSAGGDPNSAGQASAFAFSIPAGILAVGDVRKTEYRDDYFVVIDLGGPDRFNASAGGALPVVTRPEPDAKEVKDERVNTTFLAPSIVLNIDITSATAGVVAPTSTHDVYANATRDYAQGAFFGVLIDNAGDDEYLARDASQGALGGVLLDLDGIDKYTARDLSQGASLAANPAKKSRNETDLPQGGHLPGDSTGAANLGDSAPVNAPRRAAPGMVLDLGTHTETQFWEARSHSQGFARGFSANLSAYSHGILVSLDGDDRYITKSDGRYTQGVGGLDGVGLLLDRSGTDHYIATLATSQGATISQLVNSGAKAPSAQGVPHPAVGVLVDLGGGDTYITTGGSRTVERQQATTITRAESATDAPSAGGRRVYSDVGIHIDTTLDPEDPTAFVAGIGGSGSATLDGGHAGFEVDLPSARLAIGKNTATRYTREYAFVVDLGGDNTYNYSAGGHIRDYLVHTNQSGQGASGIYGNRVNLFPVTFLLDAGVGNSTYEIKHGLAQGAGFFGVGILADLGGRDQFRALNEPVESISSTWLDRTVRQPPTIDASIIADWDGVPSQTIKLGARTDARFSSDWTLRMANDNRSLYLGLTGKTTSGTDAERLRDSLTVYLDMGRRHETWDTAADRTGIDGVTFRYNTNDRTCEVVDIAWNLTTSSFRGTLDAGDPDLPRSDQQQKALEGACRFTPDGDVVYELRKDLVITETPFSKLDLAYCWLDSVGFGHNTSKATKCEFPQNDLGVFVEFLDAGAAWTDWGGDANTARFRWPANAQARDGDYTGEGGGNLSDEMRRWAAVGLATGLPGRIDGVPPIASVKPSLAQGAGIAGVGVLAMLGTGLAEAELLAADRAQGFASYNGLAILMDAGGSDRYIGTEHVQGAATQNGLAIFIDVEGNDNFVAERSAYGWTSETDPGAAMFFDLGGDDAYTARFVPATDVTQARNAGKDSGVVSTPPPWGNNIIWRQNASGFGADYRVTQAVRESIGSLIVRDLHSTSHTELRITKYNPNADGVDPNGCTAEHLAADATGEVFASAAASGKVCFYASVNTSGNTLPARVRGPAEALAGVDADLAEDARRFAQDPMMRNVSVRSVDFMLDRQRVATAFEYAKRVDATTTVWTAVVDLGIFEDGVFRAKAIPSFVAQVNVTNPGVPAEVISLLNGRTALAYTLDASDDDVENNTLGSRSLLIDNEARIRMGLTPKFTGLANATYSSKGYGAAQSLVVDWTVSHDADEDELDTKHGYKAPVWNSSFPCDGAPTTGSPTLCDQLTFYLANDGDILSTQPGTDAPATPGNLIIERPTATGSSTAPTKSSKTEVLKTDLRIRAKDSFHLAIPGRTAITATNISTFVDVYVEDAEGKRVLGEDGKAWSLGKVTRTASPTALSAAGALNLASAVASPVNNVRSQLDNVSKAIDATKKTASDTVGGNIVWGAVNATNATACAPAAKTGILSLGHEACYFLNGDVGHVGDRLQPKCAGPEPRNTDGVETWLIWYAIRSFDDRQTYPTQTGPRGPQHPEAARNVSIPVPATRADVCGSWRDQLGLNETAEDLDVLGGNAVPTGPIEELGVPANPSAAVGAIQEALNSSSNADPNKLNFTDIWFDATNKKVAASYANDIIVGDEEIVIKKGYKLVLYFEVQIAGGAASAALGDEKPGQPIRKAGADVADAVEGAHVIPEYAPGPIPLEIESQVLANIREKANSLAIIADGLSALSGLPASFYVKQEGAPDDQPRFEIRVPSRPGTTVDIALQDSVTGNVAATISPEFHALGDVPGTPTRDGATFNQAYWKARGAPADHPFVVNWTAKLGPRWTQNSVTFTENVADGLYFVNVTAKDDDRLTHRVDSVLVDHTAPQTGITTPTNVGRPSLKSGSEIAVTWSAFDVGLGNVPGSGLDRVYLYSRVGDTGDLTKGWTEQNFSEGINLKYHGIAGVDTHLFLTVGVDRAKNVEGSANAADLKDALQQAFDAKLARGATTPAAGGYQKVKVDLNPPVYKDVDIVGGRARAFQGQELTFLRAGEPVGFSICVNDDASGIGRVDLLMDHVPPGTTTVINHSFQATPDGVCGSGDKLYAYRLWNTKNADSAKYPQGIWSAMFVVYDQAGNLVRVPAGALVLDHASPTVVLQAPVLPAGQSAVKPGDQVKIRFLATDAFGVEESGISVDASAFMKGANALKTRPARVNGVIYQEATFTVDRTDLTLSGYDVIVRVPDVAGNSTTERVRVAVNTKTFEFIPGTLRATDITHNSAILRWNTSEPTSAMAKFGTSTIALNGRTPLDANATTSHALKIEGLLPSSRYHLRAVSASTGGFSKESDIIEIETKSALFLKPILPLAGDDVSGLVKIAFEGGLLDSADFVTYTLEVREGPTKAWSFITKATRQGATHELSWNSTRFLDGTTYELRLTAESGRDISIVTIGPITSDNTPPSVLVLSPLLATNDTTPRMVAEAGDSLSGLAGAKLFIDGTPVIGSLGVDAAGEGRERYSYDVPSALTAGMRLFELRVQDKAGNVAKEQWRVAIDGDAPQIRVNPTGYAPGTAAAKTAGTVTLNLTITDLSGVSIAVADTSALSTLEPSTRLVHLVGTDLWQGTFGVTAAESLATKVVTVRATDLAGNVRELALDIPLDNVAPIVGATSIEAIRHTSATILVPADEPILVTGTATAPASPSATLSTTTATKDPRLVFTGLLPSRTYTFRLIVTDRAGNEVPLTGTFPTSIDSVPPTDVGAVSVRDLLDGTLNLSWTAATDDVGVAFYRVYRSDDNGITYRVIGESIDTDHEDGSLPYEKPYVYKVAAVDHGANEGPASKPLRAAAAAVPKISVGAVAPTVGTVSTTFRYSITYLSPGGVTPAHVHIILNGVPQNMTLESGDASTGAVYVYETRLAPHKRDAPHTYSFEVSDGRFTVRLPADGSVLRGPLVSGDALAGGDAVGLASFAQRVPMGGVAGVALALVAAVGLAALISRKKKEGSK